MKKFAIPLSYLFYFISYIILFNNVPIFYCFLFSADSVNLSCYFYCTSREASSSSFLFSPIFYFLLIFTPFHAVSSLSVFSSYSLFAVSEFKYVLSPSCRILYLLDQSLNFCHSLSQIFAKIFHFLFHLLAHLFDFPIAPFCSSICMFNCSSICS